MGKGDGYGWWQRNQEEGGRRNEAWDRSFGRRIASCQAGPSESSTNTRKSRLILFSRTIGPLLPRHLTKLTPLSLQSEVSKWRSIPILTGFQRPEVNFLSCTFMASTRFLTAILQTLLRTRSTVQSRRRAII